MGDTPYASKVLDKTNNGLDQCLIEENQSFAPPTDGKSLQSRSDDTKALTTQGILPDLTLSGDDFVCKPDATQNRSAESTTTKHGTNDAPARSASEVLNDPNSSQEEKISRIIELSLLGDTKFVDSNGRKYDIVIESKGKNKTLISVHTKDEDGDSHVVLRAGIDSKGRLIHQHDDQGNEVSYTGTWASKHLKDSPLVRGPEKSPEQKPAIATGDGSGSVDGTTGKDTNADTKDASDKPAPTTSNELLRAHPELKPLSASEAKVLRNDLNALDKKQAHDSAELESKQNKLYADSGALTADLMSVGIKDYSSRKELIAQLKTVQPKERAVELANKIDALAKDNNDVQQLEARVQRQATRLKDTQDKLGFSEGLAQIDKLPQAKREEIYRNFNTLLDTNDKTQSMGLTPKERVELVHNLASQIAHPEFIKQGAKNTCAISSTEYVMAKDHPDIYVKNVTDLATKGEIHGTTIGADAIHKDDGDHARSLASKVFQTGVASVWAAEHGGQYENHSPKEAPAITDAHKPKPEHDTGERFIKEGKVHDFPGVTNSDQVKLINKLTGDNYQSEKLYATSPDLLQRQLEAEAKTYGFPIKVGFSWSDINGGGLQAHEVTIVGIDTSTTPAKVLYEDTAQGRGKPQELDMKRFYNLAVEGPFTHKIGEQSLMIIGATGPNGERAEPYVQVIHRVKPAQK